MIKEITQNFYQLEFLLLTKEVESEYYEKVEKIIGASVEGVWYRWDSTFHVEQIPYL